MAPKPRAKAISLAEFTGVKNTGGEHDWVEEWEPEVEAGAPEMTAYEKAARIREMQKKRYDHSNSAMGKIKGIGEGLEGNDGRGGKIIPKDMPPPYVAHIGNLKNGITEEELRSEFSKDVVVRVKLHSNDNRTFGFIEFTTVDALHIAIIMDGQVVQGRKIRVDIATKEQIERMNRQPRPERNSGFGSGDGAGFSLDRDAMGAQQPSFGRGGGGMRQGGMMGSGSTGSFELSRDLIGSAQKPAVDLGSWRDSEAVPQPQPRLDPRPLRENRRSEENLGEKKSAQSAGGGFAAMGNWRDSPQVPQVAEVKDEEPKVKTPLAEKRSEKKEPSGDGPRKEERPASAATKAPTKVLAREGSASKPAPKVAPKASPDANRWGALGR